MINIYIYIYTYSGTQGLLPWEDIELFNIGKLTISSNSVFATTLTTVLVMNTKFCITACFRPQFLTIITSRVNLIRSSKFISRCLLGLG